MHPPPTRHLSGLILLILLVGCGPTVVRTDNPVPITRQEYDRVFDAAIAVLRDRGFVPSREDRRFGVITTFARPASTIIEPWRNDNTTSRQALGNTLNHRRRLVRVDLEKRTGAEVDAADADGDDDDDGVQTDYRLAVAVRLEQRQHPPHNLHTAAASSIAHFGRSAGARRLVTAEGAETSFWRPLGRDAYLEQRLIAAILDRAAAAARDQAADRGAAALPAGEAPPPPEGATDASATPAAPPAKDDARS